MDEPDNAMMLYSGLMEEVKVRLGVISGVLDQLPTIMASPHGFITIESCFLQIRLTCELIALGALALHEPLGVDKGLLKKWHAQETFEAVLRLNPDAFPKAVRFTEGKGSFAFTLKPQDAMTAADLFEIYGLCGSALHRGVLKRFLKGETKAYNVDQLRDWMIKISSLLDQHVIMLNERNEVVSVSLSGGENGATLILRGVAQDNPA